jgi:AraC-like DNA-binding protein
MCLDTKKRVALQLLHFGLHRMPVAKIRDYEEIPLSFFFLYLKYHFCSIKMRKNATNLDYSQKKCTFAAKIIPFIIMQEEKIPLIDCPIDYIFGEASGKVLNEYGRFPCQIQCAVYAFMKKGTACATLNITQYKFQENDLIYVKPGSFFFVQECSEDAQLSYIVFSSSFVEKNAYGMRRLSFPSQGCQPIVKLNNEQADIIVQFSTLLETAVNSTPPMISSDRMVHIFNLIQQTYFELDASSASKSHPIPDRKAEIYQEYSDLVLQHYREWHHVAMYAEAMHITVPHLCSTIKAASGHTAGDIIVDAILMDAKAQLKVTSMPIKEIALRLGFENVAFFNRFFKSHVGVTPRAYRNE